METFKEVDPREMSQASQDVEDVNVVVGKLRFKKHNQNADYERKGTNNTSE